MAEYIEREALLATYDSAHEGPPGGARKLMANAPAADVEPVRAELRKIVRQLHKEYEKAQRQPFVRDPLAYALYQVWKAADGGSCNG